MQDVCKCGKKFGQWDRFCGNCGCSRAKRSVTSSNDEYCTRCGGVVHSTGVSVQRDSNEYHSTKRYDRTTKNRFLLTNYVLAFLLVFSLVVLTFPVCKVYDANNANPVNKSIFGMMSSSAIDITPIMIGIIICVVACLILVTCRIIINTLNNPGSRYWFISRKGNYVVNFLTCVVGLALAVLLIVLYSKVDGFIKLTINEGNIDYNIREALDGLVFVIIAVVFLVANLVLVGIQAHNVRKRDIL